MCGLHDPIGFSFYDSKPGEDLWDGALVYEIKDLL